MYQHLETPETYGLSAWTKSPKINSDVAAEVQAGPFHGICFDRSIPFSTTPIELVADCCQVVIPPALQFVPDPYSKNYDPENFPPVSMGQGPVITRVFDGAAPTDSLPPRVLAKIGAAEIQDPCCTPRDTAFVYPDLTTQTRTTILADWEARYQIAIKGGAACSTLYHWNNGRQDKAPLTFYLKLENAWGDEPAPPGKPKNLDHFLLPSKMSGSTVYLAFPRVSDATANYLTLKAWDRTIPTYAGFDGQLHTSDRLGINLAFGARPSVPGLD